MPSLLSAEPPLKAASSAYVDTVVVPVNPCPLNSRTPLCVCLCGLALHARCSPNCNPPPIINLYPRRHCIRRRSPLAAFATGCAAQSLTPVSFIQPLQALTVHLPATYRICNPGFKYESSRNPRRVLTKPSKGLKNDGYDNEDSDYILYVNDILGSEEAGHKYDIPGRTAVVAHC